jgi:uncharacterized phage protein gp47/JayE
MPYTLPSLTETQAMLVAAFKAAFPDRSISSRFGFYWKLLRVFAGGITDLHAKQQASQRAVMPSTARGAELLEWCKITGIVRKGATPARKSLALRLRGTNGSNATIGEHLVHQPSGLRYKIGNSATIPVAGYIDVDVIAIDVGALTRLEAGEVLEFLVAPPGINTRAELQLAIDEDGFDQELETSLSQRMLATFGKPASGGNNADWQAWCLAYTGVAVAYVYAGRNGIGSIDIVVFHSGRGTARIFTAPERAALLSYLINLAPAQLSGGALRVLDTVAQSISVEIKIMVSSDPQYAMDWDDVVAPIVASYNSSTKLLTFTTTRPASMKAGDRLTIAGVGSIQDAKVLTIESLSSTDAVVLSKGPSVSPVAADIVYAAGPLTEPIRKAIEAHLNGEIVYAEYAIPISASEAGSKIGLRVLAEGLGPSNENGAYGFWPGAVMRSTLQRIATYATGVGDAVVTLPATDLPINEIEFPVTDQIGFGVPQSILVRKL